MKFVIYATESIMRKAVATDINYKNNHHH